MAKKRQSLADKVAKRSEGRSRDRWENTIDPEIRKELDTYKAAEKAAGRTPIFTALADVIKEEFGLATAQSTLKRWWNR